MNLRPSSNPSLAAAWPLVKASMDRVARTLHPAAAAPCTPPRPREATKNPGVPEGLAALKVGGAMTVYCFSPVVFMVQAKKIGGAEFKASRKSEKAWTIERTA